MGLLELARRGEQLLIGLGDARLHYRQRLRGSPSRNEVLALGALHIFAVGRIAAIERIAGEQHPGPRLLVDIAERHRLNGHRSAKVVRNTMMLTIASRAARIPRFEYRADRPFQLLADIVGNLGASSGGNLGLERIDVRIAIKVRRGRLQHDRSV